MLLWGAFQKKFGQTWAFGSTGLTLGHFRKNWKTGSCPGEQLFYWVFGGKVAFFSFLLVGIGTSILLGKTKVYIHHHHLTCRDPQDASSCFSFQDDFVQCSYLSLCLFLEVVKAINHVSGEASILWGIWAGFLVGGSFWWSLHFMRNLGRLPCRRNLGRLPCRREAQLLSPVSPSPPTPSQRYNKVIICHAGNSFWNII